MIRGTLNVKIESPFWDDALKKSMEEPAVPEWLTEDYIAELENTYSLFGDMAPYIFQARVQVVSSPELCLLAKILYHIIDRNKNFREAFCSFALPKAPEGATDTLGYDYVGLFPILAHIRHFVRELTQRGVTPDIIYDTFAFLRKRIQRSVEKYGKPCLCEKDFSTFRLYVYTNFLIIGRLRFEIQPNSNRNVKAFAHPDGTVRLLMCDTVLHKNGNILGAVGYTDEEDAYDADFRETDEYYEGYGVDPHSGLAEKTRTRLPKKDWKCILQPGDTLLKVHIPLGGKLLKEDCDAAYERASRVFPKAYPEYDFKGFICNTWLLCPVLKTFLKETSNIVQFQEKYHVFPAKNAATDVFLYVYGLTVSSAEEVEPSQLPEDNTMRREVKRLLQEGKYIHQFNGFAPF